MTNPILSPFMLLFKYRRNKVRQRAITQVTSLKTIKGAEPKNPSPRAVQAKRLVSDMLAEKQVKAPEAKV